MPFILDAMLQSTGFHLDLVASVWSAPAWMKTNNQIWGEGKLKPEFYQAWSEYFIRFFEEYSNRYIDFWGVTTQNEPVDGLLSGFAFNCMGYTPEELNVFVRDYLGPTIRNSSFSNLKIVTVDDQRVYIKRYADEASARFNEATRQHL
jgi:glucosylceramidase